MAALVPSSELHEKLKRRQQSMAAVRGEWEADWDECARFTHPRLGNIKGRGGTSPNSQGRRSAKLNTKLLDDRAVWASEVLANGMATGQSSEASPWFKLGVEDTDLMAFQAVKEWLAEVERRIYSFLAKTNFYTAQKSGYLEMAVFGTQATLMVEHWRHGAVNHNLTAGEYWIGLDDALVVETLTRTCDMTTVQLYERFGPDKLPRQVREAYDRSDYQKAWSVMHSIEPNYYRDLEKIDRANKAYSSIYWLTSAGDDDKVRHGILSVGGFEERPFWAPRWDVTGSQVYGHSPTMKAMASLKAQHLNHLRKAQAKDYAVRPALQGPASLVHTHANLVPGGITARTSVDSGDIGTIWDVDPRVIGLMQTDEERGWATIDRHFYADLFMAITNMPGVQPRILEEVARRNEEKLAQLGPVISRNQNEQLRVAIDRAFGILYRTGQLPPPPEELQGMPLNVEYVGILAQMQKAIGAGSIERTLSFVGSMAAIDPKVLDKVDFDQAVDEYADRVGAPPSIIRSDDAVKKMRDARARQEQAAQAAAMAKPAADAAKAAQLLSQTDAGGTSALGSLLGATQAA